MKSMEIKNGFVYFTKDEEFQTGLPNPIDLEDIDKLYHEYTTQHEELRYEMAEDYPLIERSSIPPMLNRLGVAINTLGKVMLQTHAQSLNQLPEANDLYDK